jgi:coenzyme F420-reducing hydrogenase delta subunit
MKVIEPLCDACGMCAAICPAKAIELRGANELETNISVKERMLAFCCENSAAIAANVSFRNMDVKTESIPCGGSINGESIAAALKKYDRVLVAVCADEACKHFDGSKRACLQTEKVKRAMEKLGLDPERIEFLQISHAMPAVLKSKAESLFSRE